MSVLAYMCYIVYTLCIMCRMGIYCGAK